MNAPEPRTVRRSNRAPETVVALLQALTVVLLAGCISGKGESDARLITLEDAASTPCTLVLESTGVQLRSDIRGTHPDPGMVAARDSRGRFITASLTGGSVLLWTETGEFDHVLAQQGGGPGEVKGAFDVFVGENDSVLVRDNGRWSVFDPAGRFVRQFPGQFTGSRYWNTHLLPNGEILSTVAIASGGAPAYFHVADRNGQHLRSFGDPVPDDLEAFSEELLRLVSDRTEHGTIWVAARPGSARGYHLEEWSEDGALLRSIHRNAGWFPKGRFPTPEGERPAGQVISLHVDQAGLLLVLSSVPDPGWHPGPTPVVWELHYEVIHPDRGVVLVSGIADDRLALPVLYFGNTRDGYESQTDDDGLEWRDIVRYHLEPNDQSATDLCR